MPVTSTPDVTSGAGLMSMVAALGVAVALLEAPGWLVARAWGVRGWGGLALSVPLSCLVVGAAGLVGPVAGLAWCPEGWVLIAAVCALLAVVGVVVRRPWDRPDKAGPGWQILAVATTFAGVVSAGAILLGDAWGSGHLDAPAQAFDAVFHLGAVQTIRVDGSASSLGGVASLYGGGATYYPLVWHAVAALLPGSVPAAANATVAAMAGIWPATLAGLLATVQQGRGRLAYCGAAVVVVLSAGLVCFPVLLTTLSVWPYALSVLSLPGVLAGAVLTGRIWRASARSSPATRRGLVSGAVVTLLASCGAILAHGAGVFNLAILAAPALVAGLWRVYQTGRRDLWRWRGWWIGASVGVVLALGGGAWVMRGPLASVLGYRRAGGSAAGTLAQAVADLPMYGPVGGWVVLPLGVLTTGLAMWGWWRGRNRPTVRLWAATAVLGLVLVVLTGGPDWPLRQLGSPWYLQKARIWPVVMIPVLVLASMGAHNLLDRLTEVRAGSASGPRQGRRAPHRADRRAAWGVALAAAVVGARLPAQVELAASVHDPEQILYGTLSTGEELAFYQRMAQELPQDAVVIGAPSRGVSYVWSVAGVRVLYPMRAEPSGGAREVAVLTPGEDALCQALVEAGARLGVSDVQWYYLQVERDGAAFRYGNAPLRWDVRLAAWATTGMDLVDREVTPHGAASLWRIPECGSSASSGSILPPVVGGTSATGED